MSSSFGGSTDSVELHDIPPFPRADRWMAGAGPHDFVGTPPQGWDSTIWAFEQVDFPFHEGHFSFHDEDGDSAAAIILTSLPELGRLFLGDVPITSPGFRVAYTDIFRMKWMPPAGVVGANVANFKFKLVDSSGDVDMSPATVTLGVVATPLGSDKTINVHVGASHVFAEGDFGFSDSQGYQFHGVIIEAIPDGSSLKLGSRVMSNGDFVLRSEFSQLVWAAGAGSGGEFRLEFSVVNNNHVPGDREKNVDALLNVLSFVVVDTPPTGRDETIVLQEDGSYAFSPSDFGFADADGDGFAAVVITAIAGKGQLLLDGTFVDSDQVIEATDIGKLVWVPNKDANGLASGTVRFRVVDDSTTHNTAVMENIVTFNLTPMPETFTGTNGHDRMAGTNDNDMFYGLAGNDSINGARGADVMRGGLGNDTYVVDHASDKTIEIAGQGTDTVTSALAWTLAANVENLTLLGAKAVKGTGNALKNTLTGNAGANSLSGLAGNDILKGMNGRDVLNGGLGADKLYGGAQADSFVFDARLSAANRDMIMDFSVRDDTILLENGIFRKLVKAGKLSKDSFKLSTETRDGDDYIIYNQAKGALYYDADGSGRGAAIQFATIANHAKLTAADFVVV